MEGEGKHLQAAAPRNAIAAGAAAAHLLCQRSRRAAALHCCTRASRPGFPMFRFPGRTFYFCSAKKHSTTPPRKDERGVAHSACFGLGPRHRLARAPAPRLRTSTRVHRALDTRAARVRAPRRRRPCSHTRISRSAALEPCAHHLSWRAAGAPAHQVPAACRRARSLRRRDRK